MAIVSGASDAQAAAPAEAAAREAPSRQEVAQADAVSTAMLHLLVVVCVAGILLALVGRGGSCPASAGYSSCALKQDLRIVVSFALGALMYTACSSGKSVGEPVGKF